MSPHHAKRLALSVAFCVGTLFFSLTNCKEENLSTVEYPGFVGFDAGNEGWHVSEGGIGSYSATGGNPGGYMVGTDKADGVWYFIASESFVHETRKSYDRTLKFDLIQSATDSQVNASDVILTDGNTTLTFTTSYHPDTTWTHYSVKLDEFSGWKKGNVKATKTDMQSVLANLTDLRIRGEYRAGPDQGGLDNVILY